MFLVQRVHGLFPRTTFRYVVIAGFLGWNDLDFDRRGDGPLKGDLCCESSAKATVLGERQVC